MEHNVSMEKRELVHMTGIVDVLSFDEELIVSDTNMGTLLIGGNDLHVTKLDLDNGLLEIKGTIISINYEENHVLSKNRQSIFSKIFK